MKNICVIPARGGSKRIPRKNIKLFLGQPIITYAISAALNSKLFDHVIVSTDDEEIAKIAIQAGAEVPFLRSSKNSDDFATIADVMIEVINYVENHIGQIDYIACLFATAPFVTEKKIIEAYNHIQSNNFDSVFFVQQFSYPILRSLKKNSDGSLVMNWPEHLNTRSQDLEPAFHDAGQFYIAKKNALVNQKSFFTKKCGGILVSDLEARDIDTDEDWSVAEKIYKMNNI